MKYLKTLVCAGALLAVATALGADARRPVRFGCAYYPEAWPKENWSKDIAEMKKLGLSIIRVGEFNWGNFEPEEGRFEFSDYVELLRICETNGMDVMMCTPTATLPLWMHRKYPECEKSRRDGWRPGLGDRQSRCPSSGKFRFFSKRIAERMAEAFRRFSCIKWWQIDNELHIVAGTGLCECHECERGFRQWLKERYGTVDALNKAWNSAFWSSRFSSWDDVVLPIQKGREPWMTEYVRYQSDVYLAFAREQRDAIRRFVPGAVVTSNGSEMSGWLRLDTLYRDLGYAATDTYVRDIYYDRSRWMWGLSRGLTGRQRPFMVAEIGPFSWDAEKEDADGDLDGWVDDAVRHGAESVLFFRWRQSVNGEQTHPAILPWSGRKGRVYERVRRIVARRPVVSLPTCDVAILHSNESDQDTLVRGGNIQFGQYETTSILLNKALEARGLLPDYLISGEDVDFSGYKTVFVPVNTMVPKSVVQKLHEFVRGGGHVVAISRLNLLNPLGGSYFTEPYPVGMTDLFGIEINEQRTRSDCKYVYDRVELKDAVAAVRFKSGVFAGEPEITMRRYGKGLAWYVATLPATEEEMKAVLDVTLVAGAKDCVADKSFFRDGDTWVLSGDSITYIDLYRQTVKDVIDHFHPGNSVKVVSTAVWGQLTSEAKGRGIELKPQVVSIMLGMNNVIHHDYPVDHDFSDGAARYGKSLRSQIRQYRALGAEVVLLVPTLTDESENSFFATWNTRKGLVAFGEEMRRVAAEEQCRCVPVAPELEAAKAKLKPRQTFVTDGVHPYGWGQYEIARSLIHHLNIAEPFSSADGPRGYNACELLPQDWAFAVTNRFAAAADAPPEILITAPETCTAVVRWSVEGTSLRGEETVSFEAGVPRAFRPAVPPKGLPARIGAISRLIVSATPRAEQGRPRLAVVDLARTRVVDMTKGVCSGEVRTDVARPEGPIVATWKVEEDGPDLWISGHSTASTYPARPKPPAETWMNSGEMNGFIAMLDLRPANRFADNNFDRDMHMLCFSVLEKPWSVVPLAWEGRALQNCIYANADRTDDGYDWRLGLRGNIVDYVKFDIRTFDHIGVNFVFNDHNPDGNRIDRTPAQPYEGLRYLTPEQRLNQTMILDRKGNVPQAGGETTNVGVYAL